MANHIQKARELKRRQAAEAEADAANKAPSFEAIALFESLPMEEKEAIWQKMLAITPPDKHDLLLRQIRNVAVENGQSFDEARYECAFAMALALAESGQLEKLMEGEDESGQDPGPKNPWKITSLSDRPAGNLSAGGIR